MKMKRTLATLALAATLLTAAPGGRTPAQTQSPATTPAAAQTPASPQTSAPAAPQPAENARERTRQRTVAGSVSDPEASGQQENQTPTSAPDAGQPTTATRVTPPGSAPRRAAPAESEDEDEAALRPVYQNYMAEYVLGPEDVVSIYVFGHDRYTRTGVVIPPDGRLYHYLIPQGILVAGKTVTQVQQELTRRFDEYIIEPQVSVMLDRAVSARFSVVGDVTTPGVQTMSRRLTAFEAVMQAGGATQTADKSKVVVIRRRPDNTLTMIPVNIARIERGQAPDNVFLQPGDQVLVPGSAFRRGLQIATTLIPILSFARIFAGGW